MKKEEIFYNHSKKSFFKFNKQTSIMFDSKRTSIYNCYLENKRHLIHFDKSDNVMFFKLNYKAFRNIIKRY